MPTERPCGVEIRDDRLVGAAGESGELVLRRAEVVSLSLGHAPLTELPWLEGIAAVVLVVVTAFLVGTRLDGARSYASGGLAASALTGPAALALLGRVLVRRPALIADLRSGDRRRIWITGPPAELARLRATLKAKRWPLIG
jgi:hypothetical protein